MAGYGCKGIKALALKRIFLMLNVSKMIIDSTKCKEIFHVTGTIPIKTFKKVGSKHKKNLCSSVHLLINLRILSCKVDLGKPNNVLRI